MPIILNNITERQKLIIAKGLLDYQFIMQNWETNTKDFQDVYYEFYLKARWAVMKKPANSSSYFDLLQSTQSTDLIDIIDKLKQRTAQKSYEFSLCSKLLHTIKPESPIYDSKVREYLSKNEQVELWWHRNKGMYGKPAPRGTSEIKKIEHDWELLCGWYEKFLASTVGKEWIEWFDNNFPLYNGISNYKKVDFIIFATN